MLKANACNEMQHTSQISFYSVFVKTYSPLKKGKIDFFELNYLITRGSYGYVVGVIGVLGIGTGMIRDGTGYVTFPIKYECVVFRPFKGEVLEAVVSVVHKVITTLFSKLKFKKIILYLKNCFSLASYLKKKLNKVLFFVVL